MAAGRKRGGATGREEGKEEELQEGESGDGGWWGAGGTGLPYALLEDVLVVAAMRGGLDPSCDKVGDPQALHHH